MVEFQITEAPKRENKRTHGGSAIGIALPNGFESEMVFKARAINYELKSCVDITVRTPERIESEQAAAEYLKKFFGGDAQNE